MTTIKDIILEKIEAAGADGLCFTDLDPDEDDCYITNGYDGYIIHCGCGKAAFDRCKRFSLQCKLAKRIEAETWKNDFESILQYIPLEEGEKEDRTLIQERKNDMTEQSKERSVMRLSIDLDHIQDDKHISPEDIEQTVKVLTKLLKAGCKDGEHISQIIRAPSGESRGDVCIWQDKLPVLQWSGEKNEPLNNEKVKRETS
jgi:hypothetical protein